MARHTTNDKTVPFVKLTKKSAKDLRAKLIEQANADKSMYPQYRGYWDKWILGVMTRHVITKMGLSFAKNEYVLLAPQPELINNCDGGHFVREAYSMRTKINTTLELDWVKVQP